MTDSTNNHSLTYLDPKTGASWSFDPSSGKWTSTLGTKTSSSQTYGVLHEKVGKWAASAQASAAKAVSSSSADPVATPVLYTFGMATALNFGHNDTVGSLLSMDIPPKENQGVTVKVERDLENDTFKVVRYRAWRHPETMNKIGMSVYERQQAAKPSAWESRDGHRHTLINFDVLDPQEQAWWRALFVHRAQLRLAEKARATLTQLWLAPKKDLTGLWARVPNWEDNKRVWNLETVSRSSRERAGAEKSWALIDGVSLEEEKSWGGLEQWQTDQGTWVNGAVRLTLDASNHQLPKFRVLWTPEAEGQEGAVQELWSGSEFSTAVALGNATVHAMSKRPSLEAWELGAGAISPNARFGVGKFPTHVEQRMALVNFKERHSESQALVLGCETRNSCDNPLRSNEKNQHGTHPLQWVSEYGSSSSATYLVSKGPEDELLEIMEAVDQALREAIASFMKPEQKSRELEEEVAERLRRQTQATIGDAYNLAGDGEVLSEDPLHQVTRWQDTVVREEAKAEKHPDVLAFAKRCEELVERASAFMETLPKTLNAQKSKTTQTPTKPRM